MHSVLLLHVWSKHAIWSIIPRCVVPSEAHLVEHVLKRGVAFS